MKVRVSLSLDEKLVKELDSMVNHLTARSRSEVVERILKTHLMERRVAVILAGGEPKKLYVKELNTYRPLVDIGKRKLIEDIVLKCRGSGFNNIIIIGFPTLIAKIYEVLGDGKKYDVRVIYVEERKEFGTAKTLEKAKDYIKTDFLFLPCDQYFDFDLKKIQEFHSSHNGVVTLGIHTGTSFEWNRGRVVMDGYKIIKYEEKPEKPTTYLTSVFIGFMRPEIFNYIPPGDVHWSLQEDVFPKLAREGKLIGYPIVGNWINVHTKEDVERVRSLI